MLTALNLFHENIRRSRDLVAIFRAMQAHTTVALDLSDLLRAALVMSVSALDHFIHETVRGGMLEAHRGERAKTPAFLRFRVTLQSVLETPLSPDPDLWLDGQIREQFGYQSFQRPDRIAEAVRHITEVSLWNEVARLLGTDSGAVRDRLTLIVQRRDKIAHEADIMPDFAGQTVYPILRSPINDAMADGAINFIEQVAEAIFSLVSLDQSND